MKILIGWNETEQARDAMRLAVNLTRALDAELVVGCIRNPGSAPLEIDRAHDGWVEGFAELFEAAAAELGDTPFEPLEKRGAPARGLRELALEAEADLLVLGPSHRSPLGRILMGGVAEEFLQSAPCPVAVAPSGYASTPHPGFASISVGYDGTPESRRAIGVAGALADLLACEVDVISAVPSYVTEEPSSGPMEALKDHMHARAERGLARLPRRVRGTARVEPGGAGTVLEAHGVESDLLVVGSRDHSFARRVAERAVVPGLIAQSPCPVIFVPSDAVGQLIPPR